MFLFIHNKIMGSCNLFSLMNRDQEKLTCGLDKICPICTEFHTGENLVTITLQGNNRVTVQLVS